MAESTRDEAGAEAIAAQLEDVDRLIVVASGADRVAGRELVLKVEEACWLPSAYRDLETFLHGHLPATDERTGLVLLLTERDDREARAERARQALAASRALGHRAAAILAAGADGLVPADLTPAGRIVVPDAPDVPAPVASLLTSAMALQLVTERLARARGTNPDPIRRDDPRYAAAAAAADG
jgi:glucosamine--fructose-6-phosphate aminotransferase (isomerizing)